MIMRKRSPPRRAARPSAYAGTADQRVAHSHAGGTGNHDGGHSNAAVPGHKREQIPSVSRGGYGAGHHANGKSVVDEKTTTAEAEQDAGGKQRKAMPRCL